MFSPHPLVPIKFDQKTPFWAYRPTFWCRSHLQMKACMENLWGSLMHPLMMNTWQKTFAVGSKVKQDLAWGYPATHVRGNCMQCIHILL